MWLNSRNPRHLWFIRLLLLSLVGIGYLATVARTVSLWDCGEFIACIHILGVPHPPGTPLYMLLGKFWEMLLFFIPHVAFRINLLSVFFTLASSLLLFEICLFLCAKIKLKELLWIPASLCAAFLMSFSNTVWFNGVEAEVYAFSVFNLLLCLWIVIKWEISGAHQFSNWLILLVYVSFLGIGVHMYSMLWFPFLWFFIGLKTNRIIIGKWLKILGLLFLMSAVWIFVFPNFITQKFFMIPLSFLFIGILGYSHFKKEIRDGSFLYLGILLCTVIVHIKPFVAAILILFIMLSLLGALKNSKKYSLWITHGLSLLIGFAIIQYIPYNNLFGFIIDSKINLADFSFALAIIIIGFCIKEVWRNNNSEKKDSFYKFQFYGMIILVAIVGYSSYCYIPIRSHLNPAIDENNPETWETLEAFIERKQYGSENMLVRMFHRRGEWRAQFGLSDRIGFSGYQVSQFIPILKGEKRGTGFYLRLFLIFMVFVGAFWGWIEFRKRNVFWMDLILTLYLVSSVGLVAYMNFADGTKIERREVKYWEDFTQKIRTAMIEKGLDPPNIPDPNEYNAMAKYLELKAFNKKDSNVILYNTSIFSRIKKNIPSGKAFIAWNEFMQMAYKNRFRVYPIPQPYHREVRERDYFFTPAFVIFPIIFAFVFFMYFENYLNSKNQKFSWIICYGAALLCFCIPYFTHYKSHNRRNNFFASDYAYNLLMSCPKNALLFTNGDNDTFPLWYMQQVEKLRTDVTVINFSLANANWYGKQLWNNYPQVSLPTYKNGKEFSVTGFIRGQGIINDTLPNDSTIQFQYGSPRGYRLLVQDQILLEAVKNNYPQRPICFTSGTSARNTLGLDRFENLQSNNNGYSGHLQYTGLIKYISHDPWWNLEALDKNLFQVFRMRHLDQHREDPIAMGFVRQYKRLFEFGKSMHEFRLRAFELKNETVNVVNEKIWIDKYRKALKSFPVI